jgi:hypothetical protein
MNYECNNLITTNSNLLNITNKQDLLMNKLTLFYYKNSSITIMNSIIQGTSKISLRIIDWFVTNYSKKNNIIYKLSHTVNFTVYLNYKKQLKAYSKKQFDPFCRRDRVLFYYNELDNIVTTVGQLNFFKWALENKVIEYITSHLDEIESDMNASLRKSALSKKFTKKKRQELSESATKRINKHNIKVTLHFE